MPIPQKTKNRTTNCTHRYIAKENKSTNSKVILNSNVHSNIIYSNQVWKKSNCPSKDEYVKKMQWYMYVCIHTHNGIPYSAKKIMKICHLQQHGWT